MYSLLINSAAVVDARLLRIISEDVGVPELRDYKGAEKKSKKEAE